MKKITLIISLFALAWSSSCYAYDFYAINRQGDTIYYNFGKNNTVEVTYYSTDGTGSKERRLRHGQHSKIF